MFDVNSSDEASSSVNARSVREFDLPAIVVPGSMTTNIVFLLLITRCVLDIVFPGTKPSIAVILYLVLLLFLIANEVMRRSASPFDIALCMLLPATTFLSLLNAPYAVSAQFNFSLQCILPIVFLLLMSRSQSVDFARLRYLFLRYGMAIIFGCVVYALLFQTASESNALDYFNNNPMHTTAQLLSKASFVFLGPLVTGSWFALACTILTAAALFALNVRSALLGFVIGVASTSRRFLAVGTAGILLVAIMVSLDAAPFGDILQRLLFKGRDFLGDSAGNLSSGRMDVIWPYYTSLILESSLSEILFGHGAIWLFSSMRLFGHNDLLTLVSTYGILGGSMIFVTWFAVLARLTYPYRVPNATLFLILLVTNGVVSYQSNILLALYFSGAPLSLPFRHLGDAANSFDKNQPAQPTSTA